MRTLIILISLVSCSAACSSPTCDCGGAAVEPDAGAQTWADAGMDTGMDAGRGTRRSPSAMDASDQEGSQARDAGPDAAFGPVSQGAAGSAVPRAPAELLALAQDPSHVSGTREADQWLRYEDRVEWRYWYRDDGTLEQMVIEELGGNSQVFVYDEEERLQYRCSPEFCQHHVRSFADDAPPPQWDLWDDGTFWEDGTSAMGDRSHEEWSPTHGRPPADAAREHIFVYRRGSVGPPIKHYELLRFGRYRAFRTGQYFRDELGVEEVVTRDGFPLRRSFFFPSPTGYDLHELWKYDESGRLVDYDNYPRSIQYDAFGYPTNRLTDDADYLIEATQFQYERDTQKRVRSSRAELRAEDWPGEVVVETDWRWDGDLATLTHRQVGGSGWTMTDTVRECGTLEPTITRDDRGLIESIRAPCSTLLHEYTRGGDGPIEHVEVPDIWTHSGRPEYPSPHEPALPVQWAYRDAAIQHTASARAALASLVRTIHELAYSEDFWRAPSPEEDDAGI